MDLSIIKVNDHVNLIKNNMYVAVYILDNINDYVNYVVYKVNYIKKENYLIYEFEFFDCSYLNNYTFTIIDFKIDSIIVNYKDGSSYETKDVMWYRLTVGEATEIVQNLKIQSYYDKLFSFKSWFE